MLPILRILPVGGVLLAILLLVLALDAPERVQSQFAPRQMSMRGPLVSLDDQPEWRQMLVRAAYRRADELSRLRDLPDTPVKRASVPPALVVARLPVERVDADPEPEDNTASIVQPPPANIPVDIGEASLFEISVEAVEEPPQLVPLPQPRAQQRQVRHVRRLRHVTRQKQQQPQWPQPQPYDPFRPLFQQNPPRGTAAANTFAR